MKGKKSMAIILLSALGFASIGASCQGVDTQASGSYQFHSKKPSNQYVRMAIPSNTFSIDSNEADTNEVVEVTEVSTEPVENPTEAPRDEPSTPETIDHKNNDVEEPTETVTLGDYTYHKINDEKFKSHIAIAEKHGANLYGIPESDGFMIYHETEGILLSMSTGAAVADLTHAEVLIDYFSADAWTEYTGIVEGIQHVLETGEEVNVDLGDYVGYFIGIDNGNIVVFW
ncbi:hypothetical protein FZC74_08640 [Sutcliffiella horikoshii]|uniref:Uncharacterized protein n=1 Tax=Sutcliffiella horikoshii TaxID=79883 RepID=A0AA95B6W8_9BACI|nr:hypothetical protein [Sutcliffiella horikoshii]TYS60197.1 hypothetical protein FZC74_08640 [Sutcliffiella horikoshii]